jgi:preprotein translocase subunit YajC
MMLPVIGIMFLYTIMSSRKDKRKRAELMNAMGRGDTVQTIGGAIGTITELRDNEVVVRFEDGRVRFVKSAIQSVVKSAKNKDSSAIESKDVRNGAREAAGSEV